MDRSQKWKEIYEEREDFQIDLGMSVNQKNPGWEGKNLYKNLSYPLKKPLAYHLLDNKEYMDRLKKDGKERDIDAVLNNNNIISLLDFFVDNIETIMKEKYNNYQLESSVPGEDLAHESHIEREKAVANKKDYILALLKSIQTRQSQDFYGSTIMMSERIYKSLDKISELSDDQKKSYLESLCDFLPDDGGDIWPDSQEIEWIFTDHDVT